MNKRPFVILVEDSPTQALGISAHLQHYGITILVAKDGVIGLDLIAAQQPDLVVLDVNLPKMDGFEVCRRLKRDPKTAAIPVIMLTSLDSLDSTIIGLQAGADDYIPKDIFAADNLTATMQSLGIDIGEYKDDIEYYSQ